jgi:hypothetical protein
LHSTVNSEKQCKTGEEVIPLLNFKNYLNVSVVLIVSSWKATLLGFHNSLATLEQNSGSKRKIADRNTWLWCQFCSWVVTVCCGRQYCRHFGGTFCIHVNGLSWPREWRQNVPQKCGHHCRQPHGGSNVATKNFTFRYLYNMKLGCRHKMWSCSVPFYTGFTLSFFLVTPRM